LYIQKPEYVILTFSIKLDGCVRKMKCEICKNKIQETFLKKFLGTHVKDAKGKKHLVCFECQKKYDNVKEKMLEAL